MPAQRHGSASACCPLYESLTHCIIWHRQPAAWAHRFALPLLPAALLSASYFPSCRAPGASIPNIPLQSYQIEDHDDVGHATSKPTGLCHDDVGDHATLRHACCVCVDLGKACLLSHSMAAASWKTGACCAGKQVCIGTKIPIVGVHGTCCCTKVTHSVKTKVLWMQACSAASRETAA